MGIPTQFATHLWIGSINAAMNKNFLREQNITAVLTCGNLELPWCDNISSSTCSKKNNPLIFKRKYLIIFKCCIIRGAFSQAS
jgi:hypothetical protein